MWRRRYLHRVDDSEEEEPAPASEHGSETDVSDETRRGGVAGVMKRGAQCTIHAARGAALGKGPYGARMSVVNPTSSASCHGGNRSSSPSDF